MRGSKSPLPPLVVGVDVGGTKIAAAVVDSAGELFGRVQHATVLTSAEATLEGIAAAVEASIASSGCERGELRGVGLGVPGRVDSAAGIGVHSVNLGWRNAPVRVRLETLLGIPCSLENDVKAAALGEARFGAGRGFLHLVYLVIGTGVAAAVISDGRLLQGAQGMAGEIGHAILDPAGPLCKCGLPGCLEALVSGPSLAARAQARMGSSAHVPDIFAAASTGDTAALSLLDEWADALAQAVDLLIMSYNPQRLILGGGVSQAGPLVLTLLRRRLDKWAAASHVLADVYQPEMICLSALGAEAGILGAAALVSSS